MQIRSPERGRAVKEHLSTRCDCITWARGWASCGGAECLRRNESGPEPTIVA